LYFFFFPRRCVEGAACWPRAAGSRTYFAAMRRGGSPSSRESRGSPTAGRTDFPRATAVVIECTIQTAALLVFGEDQFFSGRSRNSKVLVGVAGWRFASQGFFHWRAWLSAFCGPDFRSCQPSKTACSFSFFGRLPAHWRPFPAVCFLN